jgi:hypothetical protein
MIRTFMIAAASAAALSLSPTAFAQQSGGNAGDARAMLTKAIAAVKADKSKALDMFNKGEGGFRDRDLYPFCWNVSDGKLVANSNASAQLGLDVRDPTVKDPNGKEYGKELYAAAKEGQITEVSYMFPKPGADNKPVPKVSLVTRVGELGCGVGYYK